MSFVASAGEISPTRASSPSSSVESSQARTDSSASAGERTCASIAFAVSVGEISPMRASSSLSVARLSPMRGTASASAAARVWCAMTCAASAGERMRAGRTDGEAAVAGVGTLAETSVSAAVSAGAAVAEVGAAVGASAKRWSTMPLRSERRDCCKGVGAGRESEPTWGVPEWGDEADARGDRTPVPTGGVPVLGNEAEPAAGGAAVVHAAGTTTADGPLTPTDTGLAAGRWPRR